VGVVQSNHKILQPILRLGRRLPGIEKIPVSAVRL